VVREDNSVTTIEPVLIASLDKEAPRRRGGNGSSRRSKS
jgi:hypothetical protein